LVTNRNGRDISGLSVDCLEHHDLKIISAREP
jgi:hypothetical protein